MSRAALLVGLLSLFGCLAEDRVALRFDDASTRAEAQRVNVFAVRTLTRGGDALTCTELISAERSVLDQELVIAQQVEVALASARDREAVLVQLPQDAYAFYAAAYDAFGFLVAQGCVEDEVSSRRPLDLALELTTRPAPAGRLELVGESNWLQSVGGADALVIPEISVRALSHAGRPLADVEVRTLVQQGEAIVDRLLLTDDGGLARARPSVGEGENTVLVHARGLEGSPLTFTITGLAAARYHDTSLRMFARPVALLADNFYAAGDDTDDLLAVLWNPVLMRGEMAIWTAAVGPQDIDRLGDFDDIPRFAAAGRFDDDDKVDLAVAAAEASAIYVLRHDHEADNLRDAVAVPLYPLPLPIHALISARVNDDDYTDLLVLVGGVPGLRLLVLVSRAAAATISYPALFDMVQAIDLSALGEFQLVAADLDVDGDDDLALLRYGTTIYLLPNGDETGAGGGHFYGARNRVDDPWALPSLASAEGEKYGAVADYNGDGALDLAIAVNGQLELIPPLLTMTHGGERIDALTLEQRPEVDLGLSRIDRLGAGDFNGDGHADLIAVTNSPPQRAALLAGDGIDRFAVASPMGVGMSVVDLAIADLNDDGADDIGFLGRVYAGPEEGADPDQSLDDYMLVQLSAAR